MNKQAHTKIVESLDDVLTIAMEAVEEQERQDDQLAESIVCGTRVNEMALINDLHKCIAGYDEGIERVKTEISELELQISEKQSELADISNAKARCLAAIDADVKTEVVEG